MRGFPLRSLIAAASAAVFAAAAVPSLAQTPPAKPPAAPGATPPEPPKRPSTLEELFERLAKATDLEEANGIAQQIERRWHRHQSDTANLLMVRALNAMQGGPQQDLPLAVEILDRLIVLEPGWAEAWNKRATAFYMLGDSQRSLLDVREVLAREPRHYGALAGLGHIMAGLGDNKRAVEAYRKALAVHPYLESLKKTVERLRPEVDGRDI